MDQLQYRPLKEFTNANTFSNSLRVLVILMFLCLDIVVFGRFDFFLKMVGIYRRREKTTILEGAFVASFHFLERIYLRKLRGKF